MASPLLVPLFTPCSFSLGSKTLLLLFSPAHCEHLECSVSDSLGLSTGLAESFQVLKELTVISGLLDWMGIGKTG